MTMSKWLLATALLVSSLPGWGERHVNQRVAAASGASVHINVGSGTLKVVGWNQAAVEVQGQVTDDEGGVSLRARGDRVDLEVEGDPHQAVDLEVSVPAGAALVIDSFAAETTVVGVKGSLRYEAVNAGVHVEDGAGELELSTVNGAIDAQGGFGEVRIECTNGAVTLRGASGDVEASTVNGRLDVSGVRLKRGQFETVSGALSVQATLEKKAELSLESVSGSIELSLPAATSASFEVSTQSGRIVNELGPAARRDRDSGQTELSFTSGDGLATVEIHTLSGSVRLRKR